MKSIENKQEQEKPVELADIVLEGISRYKTVYGSLPPKHWKVVNNICRCRTEALGGHICKCDTCGHEAVTYNSCRDRHCPKCQGVARAVWIDRRMAELLPVGYFHVVFTVPDQFNKFAVRNKKVFYNILYRSVSETLLELGRDPRWLGGNIGCMAMLHSWGQNMLDHPHIHCVVPGGGIRLDGKKWVSFRNNYLFPTKVMAQLFRGKFLDYFTKAIERSKISLIGELHCYQNRETLQKFLKAQWSKDWVVYAKKPFGSPVKVVKYLGRYTHRIAISNKRIVSQSKGKVAFWWKDYADENKQKIMELDTVEFLRRFFLHVLPEGFVRIRYYGFLSNGNKTERLQKCFKLLNKKYKKKQNYSSIVTGIFAIIGIDITVCPQCHIGHFYQYKEIMKTPHEKLCLAA